MTEREIWTTPYGMMGDLIACYKIHNSLALPDFPVNDEEMIPNYS